MASAAHSITARAVASTRSCPATPDLVRTLAWCHRPRDLARKTLGGTVPPRGVGGVAALAGVAVLGGDDAFDDGAVDGGGAAGDFQLAVDVVEVVGNRPGTDLQRTRYHGRGAAHRGLPQDRGVAA